jgi:hypothetical protein
VPERARRIASDRHEAVLHGAQQRSGVQDGVIPAGELPSLAGFVYRFAVYDDLPLSNLDFCEWHVRNITNGCPGQRPMVPRERQLREAHAGALVRQRPAVPVRDIRPAEERSGHRSLPGQFPEPRVLTSRAPSGRTHRRRDDIAYDLNSRITPAATPKAFALAQNYPNPFNPSTTIKYDVKAKGLVTVKIYNCKMDTVEFSATKKLVMLR